MTAAWDPPLDTTRAEVILETGNQEHGEQVIRALEGRLQGGGTSREWSKPIHRGP